MIQLQKISKHFGNLQALQNISLTIRPNQIHGLLGENGAGKSTLMNILFGLLQPTTGTILLNNTPTKISSPRIAQAHGIGMVHQHFKLVPTLTVLENLALALHASTKKITPAATALMHQLHWPIPLTAPIANLSVGQQQRVEILKALLTIRNAGILPASPRRTSGILPASPSATAPTQDSGLSTQHSLLILDEPTAVLTPQETTELFLALQTLKLSPNTAIIFISHKLNEVQKICDTLTILRRGIHIHTGPTAELTPTQMTEKMVGSAIELPGHEKGVRSHFLTHPALSSPSTPAVACVVADPASAPQPSNLKPELPPILELKNLSSGILKSATLQIPPGTILGIAGVDGNGQSDLAQAIVGGQPIAEGSLSICGQPANHLSIRQRSQHLAYIPEDRHRQALILPMSITQNLLLKEYRLPPYSTAGWLHFKNWSQHARTLIQKFDIRTNSPAASAAQLSGGNQQKVVLARELHNPAKPLILAINPTRGLDIGATAFVLNQLLQARARGAAILLIHSDLDELLAISDSISVLFNGTLTPAPSLTKESIGPLMLGLTNATTNSGPSALP